MEKLQKDLETKQAESEGLAATLHSLEVAASEATSEKEKLKIMVDRSSEDMERVMQVGGRGGGEVWRGDVWGEVGVMKCGERVGGGAGRARMEVVCGRRCGGEMCGRGGGGRGSVGEV